MKLLNIESRKTPPLASTKTGLGKLLFLESTGECVLNNRILNL